MPSADSGRWASVSVTAVNVRGSSGSAKTEQTRKASCPPPWVSLQWVPTVCDLLYGVALCDTSGVYCHPGCWQYD